MLRLILALVLIISAFRLSAQTSVPAAEVKLADNDTTLRIFEKVEQEASFTGGASAWIRFLQKNMNPNVPVDNDAPCGRYTVVVQFIVDKTGNIADVKALTKLGYGMEEEVVRLIKRGPKWEPAMHNGKPVNAYRKQPVTFQVEDESFEIVTNTPYQLKAKVENEISILTDKVKPENLYVTISQGSIIPLGDGRYKVKVNKPGRVVIELFNAKKNNKKIGAASFEVN